MSDIDVRAELATHLAVFLRCFSGIGADFLHRFIQCFTVIGIISLALIEHPAFFKFHNAARKA